MHEAALAQAALPAPTFILGLRLRPYSLGHELWLIRENNPILDDPRLVTITHLAQAVLICCQTFEQNQRMNGDWLMGLKLWAWRRRLRRVEWQRELESFLSYREQGTLQFPKSGRRLPGAGPVPHRPGAPFLLRLYQFLVMRNFAGAGSGTRGAGTELGTRGARPSEGWDFPFGLAVMHWQAYWESEERLELQNEADLQHDAYVAAEEAKAAAESNGDEKEEPCRA